MELRRRSLVRLRADAASSPHGIEDHEVDGGKDPTGAGAASRAQDLVSRAARALVSSQRCLEQSQILLAQGPGRIVPAMDGTEEASRQPAISGRFPVSQS